MQLARARCRVLNVRGPDTISRRAVCYTSVHRSSGATIGWHDGEPLPWLGHVYRHLSGGGPNTWRARFSSDHEVVYS